MCQKIDEFTLEKRNLEELARQGILEKQREMEALLDHAKQTCDQSHTSYISLKKCFEESEASFKTQLETLKRTHARELHQIGKTHDDLLVAQRLQMEAKFKERLENKLQQQQQEHVEQYNKLSHDLEVVTANASLAKSEAISVLQATTANLRTEQNKQAEWEKLYQIKVESQKQAEMDQVKLREDLEAAKAATIAAEATNTANVKAHDEDRRLKQQQMEVMAQEIQQLQQMVRDKRDKIQGDYTRGLEEAIQDSSPSPSNTGHRRMDQYAHGKQSQYQFQSAQTLNKKLGPQHLYRRELETQAIMPSSPLEDEILDYMSSLEDDKNGQAATKVATTVKHTPIRQRQLSEHESFSSHVISSAPSVGQMRDSQHNSKSSRSKDQQATLADHDKRSMDLLTRIDACLSEAIPPYDCNVPAESAGAVKGDSILKLPGVMSSAEGIHVGTVDPSRVLNASLSNSSSVDSTLSSFDGDRDQIKIEEPWRAPNTQDAQPVFIQNAAGLMAGAVETLTWDMVPSSPGPLIAETTEIVKDSQAVDVKSIFTVSPAGSSNLRELQPVRKALKRKATGRVTEASSSNKQSAPVMDEAETTAPPTKNPRVALKQHIVRDPRSTLRKGSEDVSVAPKARGKRGGRINAVMSARFAAELA